ncbi:membrane dipeptidase [Planctomycetota bacterium]
MLEYSDVWDFHIDARLLVTEKDPEKAAYRERQLDLDTCGRFGGIFNATGRRNTLSPEEQWKIVKEEIEVMHNTPGMSVVRNSSEAEGTGKQVIHAEGIYFIQEEKDFDKLEEMWELGFRSLAPLYNEDNAFGGGAKGDPLRGLTPFGKDFMKRAWDRGFLLDCAHCNHKSQKDAAEYAHELGTTLHYTHGLTGDPVLEFFSERGIQEETLKLLFETGGLAGLSPHPGFYGWFSHFIEDIKRIAEYGPDQVVLGSDFAGINTPPVTFSQFPSGMSIPQFAELLAQETDEDFARKFCGSTLKHMVEKSLPSE